MLVIDCPQVNDHIVVTGPGSGSGWVGTICVRGHVTDFFDGFGGEFVRVRVLNGDVSQQSLPPPWPTPGDGHIDAQINGTYWCAKGVPTPASSPAGAPLTVVAWLLFGSGSGSGPGPLPQSAWFVGGGTSPRDCCSGYPCGSGSGGSDILLAGELASHPDLQITVSSGMNAGAYRATAVAVMTWAVTIGGVPYRLVCTAKGASLTIHGPSSSAPSVSFETDPFSATFPGDIFDADDEIVVIVA